MAKKKKIIRPFVLTETGSWNGKPYHYYRDTAKEALEQLFFLYNDWREEVKLPSGRMPPKLSSRQVVRLTLELEKNKKTTLKSPKSWDQQFEWVVKKI